MRSPTPTISSGTLHLKPGTQPRGAFGRAAKTEPKAGPITRKTPMKDRAPVRYAALQFLINTSPTWRKRLPMAVGFHIEAMAEAKKHGVSINQVRQLIGWRGRSAGYQQAVANATRRYDFHGNPCGFVSDRERTWSKAFVPERCKRHGRGPAE